MKRVEEAGRVVVPADFGFDYITDVANWPAYWPLVLEITDDEPSWNRPGDQVHVVMREGGMCAAVRGRHDRDTEANQLAADRVVVRCVMYPAATTTSGKPSPRSTGGASATTPQNDAAPAAEVRRIGTDPARTRARFPGTVETGRREDP